jgi:diadenosine tetraphosphate (Ap4A) HIT family hydrolase
MSDTTIMESFKGKFRLDELLILRNDSWSWSVRPWQPTLGSGVLSLNRFAPRLSAVTPDEMKDLAAMISAIEGGVRQVFNYKIMNYLILMMVDHQVHVHVIPRYDTPRIFGGLTWVDNGWPGGAVMTDSQHEGNDTVLFEMQAALKAAQSPSGYVAE